MLFFSLLIFLWVVDLFSFLLLRAVPRPHLHCGFYVLVLNFDLSCSTIITIFDLLCLCILLVDELTLQLCLLLPFLLLHGFEFVLRAVGLRLGHGYHALILGLDVQLFRDLLLRKLLQVLFDFFILGLRKLLQAFQALLHDRANRFGAILGKPGHWLLSWDTICIIIVSLDDLGNLKLTVVLDRKVCYSIELFNQGLKLTQVLIMVR